MLWIVVKFFNKFNVIDIVMFCEIDDLSSQKAKTYTLCWTISASPFAEPLSSFLLVQWVYGSGRFSIE